MVINELYEHQKLIQKVIDSLTGDIESACEIMTLVLKNGNKVLLPVMVAALLMHST
jgi:D-sedoheptulose 7-phosphate isomerase